MNIKFDSFCTILAALSVLPVENLWMSGNPCEVNCDGHGNVPRYIVIRFMKPVLKVMDGVAIDPHERESAIKFVDKMPDHVRSDVTNRVNWDAVRDLPSTARLATRLAKEKKLLFNDRYFSEKRGRCDPFAVGVDPTLLRLGVSPTGEEDTPCRLCETQLPVVLFCDYLCDPRVSSGPGGCTCAIKRRWWRWRANNQRKKG
jgi:hypothetical protein